jgi:hypothetical protein
VRQSCDGHPAALSDGSGENSTAFVDFYRRLAMRIGKAKAITATARKLAVVVYRVLSGQLVYHDFGAAAYQQLNRTRELKSLSKRAKLFGFENSIARPVKYS